ncbi:MAG: hypothetical protein IJN66_04825 [Muribaculaceae bacterium]|nr:hypothetical protein [Muribaculaceae bacterium]
MKEQKLSNQESLDLITTMIQNSKKRMELGSGNILIAWGYVTTIIALIIGCGLLLTNNVLWMWLWFAIPAIGYPLHYFLAKKKENKTLAKTTVDNYISGIWATIGIFFAILMIICFIFGMNNYNAWGTMFLMTLPCCGFGATSTGIILKEKSLIIGGMTSMIIGALFIICYICQINIFGYDTFAFALSFAVMMIIPGHIINKKAKAKC